MARDKVYIIGFMGSGKTTIGKKLASILNWKFTDLDEQIEITAGKSIKEIFSVSGEEYFRKLESDALKNTESLRNTVISTGGGVPCYGNNIDFMLSHGITVYLNMTPEELTSRLSGEKESRPLISSIENSDLLTYINEKLSEREKYYNKAEITINGNSPDIVQLAGIVNTRL
ncbi:MAG TPA: shikimate kinase [Bacteroidales bacterium]|nr:shikimate kinase [Bacteroidales bacterium]